MTVTETDLVQRTTPDTIRNRRFATVRRGYDRDQVREYLERLAAHVATLEDELGRVRAESESIERSARSAREDAYRELSSRVADVIRTADMNAQETRKSAGEEAERMVLDARIEADRIRQDAEVHAAERRRESDDALERARAESERMLASLGARRDAILADLQGMKERLVGVVDRLETTVTLPEADDPLDQEPSPVLEEEDDDEDWNIMTTDTIDLVLPEMPSLEDEIFGDPDPDPPSRST
jgi:DivIVA domain-containing protein